MEAKRDAARPRCLGITEPTVLDHHLFPGCTSIAATRLR